MVEYGHNIAKKTEIMNDKSNYLDFLLDRLADAVLKSLSAGFCRLFYEVFKHKEGMVLMKTFMAKSEGFIRKWYVVDGEGKVLGRLASEVAKILRGKHKPEFTPHTDTGDFVIILNAEKVILTGNKLEQKYYRHYSGYPGGMKEIKYKQFMATKSDRAVELAVKGMLPHNILGRAMFKKLKVYKGPVHEHQAQKPEVLVINV